MAFVATRSGPSTIPASDGSRTITVLDSQPREEGDEDGSRGASTNEIGRLALRGGRSRPRVVWTEDTVDNEGAGKKSSKICCVYHKPRKFDESSSDESSADDSDSSCAGQGHSHGPRRRNRHRHHHHHAGSAEDGGQSTRRREGGETVVHELESESEEVNRYERGSGKGKKGKGVVRK